MKVRDEHLYHGAALNQIAEHKSFTAINSLRIANSVSRSAFLINDHIAVYLKYATKPSGGFKEYIFTFTRSHLRELKQIRKQHPKTFVSLICVKDREICCLSYEELIEIFRRRKEAMGKGEKQYNLLVTVKHNEAFRVYINDPNEKGTWLFKPKKIVRNRFPKELFN